MTATNTRDILYACFVEATNQICFDLQVDPKTKNIEKDDHFPEGHAFYTASGCGARGEFRFTVDLNEKSKYIEKRELKAGLSISYAPGAAPFYIHEEISFLEGHDQFLGRWAAWAVHNFNLEHNPVNLESKFQDTSIRVYGIPQSSHPTVDEMKLLVAGIEKYQWQLLVYRFRHVSQDYRYRSFSYSFLIKLRGMFWVFFSRLGGLDSGGAAGDYEETEKQLVKLGKKIKVIREYYDIAEEPLQDYLKDCASSFETCMIPNSRWSLIEPTGIFGDTFNNSYSRFVSRYQDNEFPQAMRDLRVLVQRALKYTCRKKHVKISDIEDPNISNLAGRLAGRHVITKQVSALFTAFGTAANQSAHDDYPTEKDMEDANTEHRISLTFVLGTQLICELESVMSNTKKTITSTS